MIFYTDSTSNRWRFWTWPLASLPDIRQPLLFLQSPWCCSTAQLMLSVDLDDDFLSQNYSIPRNFHKSLDMRSWSERTQCSRVWKLSLWIQLNDSQLLIKQEFIRLSLSIIIWVQLSPFGCQTSWHIDGIINSADKIKIHFACIIVSDGWYTTET